MYAENVGSFPLSFKLRLGRDYSATGHSTVVVCLSLISVGQIVRVRLYYLY